MGVGILLLAGTSVVLPPRPGGVILLNAFVPLLPSILRSKVAYQIHFFQKEKKKR
jgi:hypothetical protein